MLFLVFFIVVALLVALKGNKKFILFFMAFYPVLPDYFAIELGGGLPLLKASRILLLILLLCVCFRNKKIKLIRKPLKAAGLYWPLIIYFAARILANGYYVSSLSAAINTEFTVIVEQLLLLVLICQIIQDQEDVYLCVKTIVDASGIIAVISIINVLIGSNLFYSLNTVSRNVLMVSTVRMGIIRAEATFGHPVYYAMYCALIIPLALYMWQNERRMWNGCILGLNIVAAFLTESRGTIVVLLALLLVFILITDKKTRNKILCAGCVIACLVFLISVTVPTVSQQFTNIIKSVIIAFIRKSFTDNTFKNPLYDILTYGTPGCTFVFNKALMEKLKQYKPSVISMHDSWISFVCLAVNGFFYSDQNAYIMYRQHDANVLGAQRHSLKDTLMGIVKNKNVLRSDMAKEILKGYSEMMPEKTKEAFITFAEYKENLKYKLKILMLPYNKKKTTKRTFEKVKLRIVFNTI